MESKDVVFEGKTLDDAVRKGLEALRLARAEVMITVLEEGSGGFLGIGARPYRVRVMPRPRRERADSSERPERGRSERPDRRGRPGRSERGGREARAGQEAREGREGRQGRDGLGRRPSRRVAGAPVRAAGPGEERGQDRRRGGRGGPVERADQIAPAAGAARPHDRGPRHDRGRPGRSEPRASRAVEESAAEEGPLMSPEELAALARRHAEELFRAMGFDVKLSVRAEGTNVEVRAEIPTDGDGELITGQKGEVRQALQHLLNRMLNRGRSSRYHLQLEINDFWLQRERELEGLARRLAEEALTGGTEKLTEYLNAQERRIVHVTLRDDARVKTYAIGDGLIKKVAVAPADYPESPEADG